MIKKILLFIVVIGCFSLSLGHTKEFKTQLKFRKNSISDRDLLGRAAHWQSQKGRQLMAAQRQLTASEDTVKLNVLAIRVEFVEDIEDASTGNGKFDLSARKEIMLDPTPHNKPYFEAQLQAVSNYYRSVSGGKLILQGLNSPYGDIYPEGQNGAYQLAHEMSYYGTDESDLLRDTRLVKLFEDAWLTADENDNIDFSKYDCFVVFHAGVGGDLALDFDETPYDISSAFLSFDDLKQYLADGSAGYQGIAVQNGATFIRDGIVLPETQNQDDIEFGLLGTATLMFGSQIGLPSLFNTATGASGIGKWGLMDQGSGNFTGLIPAQPCAWSKVFMGWIEPEVITSGTSLPVAAALATNTNKIYKVPINSKEYFLIENRQQHMLKSPDIAVAYDQNGVRVELKRDGTMAQRAADDTFRVIVSVDEYDFECPGSGLLIWHIDENVIEDKYADNGINTDPEHRGVDLEEAHGSQDIGGSYSYLHPAYGSENGVAENAFWNENESNLYVNDYESVQFTPTSNPGSWSNTRANTHISITNFSGIDSVMTFDLTIDLYQAGFPQTLGAEVELTPNSLFSYDMDDDQKEEIFAASTDGKVYAWKTDGTPFIASNYTVEQKNLLGESVVDTVALFAVTDDSILLPPTIVDFEPDYKNKLVVVTKNGHVYCWSFLDENSDGRADLMDGFPVDLNAEATVVQSQIGQRRGITVGLATGELVLVGSTGDILWRSSFSNSAISGFTFSDGDKDYYLVTTASGEVIYTAQPENAIIWQKSFGCCAGQPVESGLGNLDTWYDGVVIPFQDGMIRIFEHSTGDLKYEFKLPVQNKLVDLALGDINKDGLVDIITVAEDQLFAYHQTGVAMENFPVKLVWNTEISGFNHAVPAIGDINDDGILEMFVGSENGDIQAFSGDGEIVDNFPLSTAKAVNSMLMLRDLDGDSDIELAAIASDNSLYVWDLAGKFEEGNVPWGVYRGNVNRMGSAGTSASVQSKGSETILSAYNYPNPTEGNSTTIRYELTDPIYSVKIFIYDIAGELIDELEGTTEVLTPNEVIWNLENIESGIYLARISVEALQGNEPDEKIIKIAVVK